ncbi:MAG: alkaline phosphatase D family protein, partial [Bacteroidota bacterium]
VIILYIFLLPVLKSLAQPIVSPTASNQKRLERNQRVANENLPFDASLQPFYHGVASGDPLSDRVVIWTRVTPEADETEIEVNWMVATDTAMQDKVAEGVFTTNQDRDFTVKVDVTGLNPATTYFYVFSALEKNSIIGRTRTTPDGDANQLRFAVVSCSNYQAGYFNAYRKIAERKDLDAIIHLGDYIYEYAAGAGTYGFDSTRLDRINIPDNEILTLIDYRTRYSLYRLDPDLRAAHQQHPIIAVWDDHESANDAYKDGAENHNEGEGSWEDRKEISKKVYFEWLPIRDETDQKIYRTISYGNLADLIMLDTRLEGREEQILNVADTNLYAPERTLLGETQKAWFLDELQNSSAKWKVIGNQVIFADFNVWWSVDPTAAPPLNSAIGVESIFLDIWDGYPAERDSIINFISGNEIDNVVWLTGDFHTTFAYDVALEPVALTGGSELIPQAQTAPVQVTPTYNGATGEGSVAVEFATPSITSANFDENLGITQALFAEFFANNPFSNDGLPQPVFPEEIVGVNPNPHMKYTDFTDHGYFVLDLSSDSAQADWFFVNILAQADDTENPGESWYTLDAENHLNRAAQFITGKSSAPELAPEGAFQGIVTSTDADFTELAVFNIFPNPAEKGAASFIQYALTQNTVVKAELVSVTGQVVKSIFEGKQTKGNYTLTFQVPEDLSTGIYLLKLQTTNMQFSRRIAVD